MKSLLLRLGVLLSLGVFFSLTGYAQKSPQNLTNISQPSASANVKLLASNHVKRWQCKWFLKHTEGLHSKRTYQTKYVGGPVYAYGEARARSKASRSCSKYHHKAVIRLESKLKHHQNSIRLRNELAVHLDLTCGLFQCKEVPRKNLVRHLWYCNWVLKYRNTTKQGNRRYYASSEKDAISRALHACEKVRRDGIKAMEDYIKTIQSTHDLRNTLRYLKQQQCLSPRCDFR